VALYRGVPAIRVKDDLGRDVVLGAPPRRIVSLVPSDTHTLVALGAEARVVGRTRYCHDAVGASEIGGTKDVDVDAVLALAPDLIIANQEENARPALERLADTRVPMLVSMPRRAADGVAHLARLARLLGVAREPGGAALVRRGYALFADPPPAARVKVATLIWNEPLMTMNADTYGSDVLAAAGAANVFADRLRLYPLGADLGKMTPVENVGRDVRYPRVTIDELAARGPEIVLLPDEPYTWSDDEVAAIARGVPGARVVRTDGKDLFWYGAWTIDAVPRLRAMIATL
jgi:ABC-type Fe3+-hydroxamate transport system substrate-binding protein